MSLRPSHIAEANILSFQQGEERGFDYYFRLWYQQLCFFANRYMQQPASAEEIVSDAYLKVWKKHAQFTNEKVLRSYLYNAVRNSCLNRLEKEKKIIHLPTSAPDKTMLEHMIHAEVMQDIYRHMRTLPNQCKSVFTHLYIDGKSVKETAEEMNLSVSTIKTQKARALAYIKGKMRPLLISLLLSAIVSV